MENRHNEETENAQKAKKESKEKWAAQEENICANVQAAQAAAEAVLKTPLMKKLPVLHPRNSCRGLSYFETSNNTKPTAIVSPFQRQTTQTTQVRMTMMTMMTTTQSQGTVSAVSTSQDSDIIVLGGNTA